MYDYEIGDRVVIRSLASLLDEFGVNARNGDIRIATDGIWFVRSMRQFCGQTHTITKVFENVRGSPRYKIDDGAGWSYSASMFEHSDEHVVSVDESDFLNILNA